MSLKELNNSLRDKQNAYAWQTISMPMVIDPGFSGLMWVGSTGTN